MQGCEFVAAEFPLVLFTDGRIEANKTDEDVQKGLPNFVNVIGLIGKLGVKIYLIVVGDDVNPEVKAAMIEEWGHYAEVNEVFDHGGRFDAMYRAAYATDDDVRDP